MPATLTRLPSGSVSSDRAARLARPARRRKTERMAARQAGGSIVGQNLFGSRHGRKGEGGRRNGGGRIWRSGKGCCRPKFLPPSLFEQRQALWSWARIPERAARRLRARDSNVPAFASRAIAARPRPVRRAKSSTEVNGPAPCRDRFARLDDGTPERMLKPRQGGRGGGRRADGVDSEDCGQWDVGTRPSAVGSRLVGSRQCRPSALRETAVGCGPVAAGGAASGRSAVCEAFIPCCSSQREIRDCVSPLLSLRRCTLAVQYPRFLSHYPPSTADFQLPTSSFPSRRRVAIARLRIDRQHLDVHARRALRETTGPGA